MIARRHLIWGGLVILLFLGALFWAKARDPFSRRWFTLRTAEHGSFKCVAVLLKPIHRYPVIIYAHGSGGSLMNDGKELRQMAELGLAVVSLEYNQSNAVVFNSQLQSLLKYVSRQKWADTNAIAWVGFSLGENRMMDAFAELSTLDSQLSTKTEPPHVVSYAAENVSEHPPQLLILVSGTGVGQSTLNSQLSTNFRCPVLLVHADQDELFPVADTGRLAEMLQTNGVPVELKIIPGVPHGLEPERGVIFRCVGEYCREHLATRNSELAWQRYHSIARWQAEAPALWFCLPAIAWAVGWTICLRCGRNGAASAPASGGVFRAVTENLGPPEAGCEAQPATPGADVLPGRSRAGATLRWFAVLLAMWALAETTIHLITPQFTVNHTTLSIARRFSISSKQCADFDYLAAQAIWQNEKLKTLLQHVELAAYNRELINWQLDDKVYQDYVLSPVIELSTLNSQPSTHFDWRRPLWEEFYPRIRHESSPEDAARIVVRHLRERVTILSGVSVLNRREPISKMWEKQITDEEGFELIYLAALRSVGIPSKMNAFGQAEIFANGHWLPGPRPMSW